MLLLAYSLGLGVAFVLAGVAFARAMGAFRWLRDHYKVIRLSSGAMLVALGLLLFFDRDWWLTSLTASDRRARPGLALRAAGTSSRDATSSTPSSRARRMATLPLALARDGRPRPA